MSNDDAGRPPPRLHRFQLGHSQAEGASHFQKDRGRRNEAEHRTVVSKWRAHAQRLAYRYRLVAHSLSLQLGDLPVHALTSLISIRFRVSRTFLGAAPIRF